MRCTVVIFLHCRGTRRLRRVRVFVRTGVSPFSASSPFVAASTWPIGRLSFVGRKNLPAFGRPLFFSRTSRTVVCGLSWGVWLSAEKIRKLGPNGFLAVFQSTSPYGTTGCCVTPRCEPGAAPPIQGSRSPCTASAAANSPSFLTERADGQDSRRRTSALATTSREQNAEARRSFEAAADVGSKHGGDANEAGRTLAPACGWLAARGGAHPER